MFACNDDLAIKICMAGVFLSHQKILFCLGQKIMTFFDLMFYWTNYTFYLNSTFLKYCRSTTLYRIVIRAEDPSLQRLPKGAFTKNFKNRVKNFNSSFLFLDKK